MASLNVNGKVRESRPNRYACLGAREQIGITGTNMAVARTWALHCAHRRRPTRVFAAAFVGGASERSSPSKPSPAGSHPVRRPGSKSMCSVRLFAKRMTWRRPPCSSEAKHDRRQSTTHDEHIRCVHHNRVRAPSRGPRAATRNGRPRFSKSMGEHIENQRFRRRSSRRCRRRRMVVGFHIRSPAGVAQGSALAEINAWASCDPRHVYSSARSEWGRAPDRTGPTRARAVRLGQDQGVPDAARTCAHPLGSSAAAAGAYASRTSMYARAVPRRA